VAFTAPLRVGIQNAGAQTLEYHRSSKGKLAFSQTSSTWRVIILIVLVIAVLFANIMRIWLYILRAVPYTGRIAG